MAPAGMGGARARMHPRRQPEALSPRVCAQVGDLCHALRSDPDNPGMVVNSFRGPGPLGAGRAGRRLCASLLLLLAACSPTLDWRELRVADTALVTQWPCKPQRSERRVPLADGSVTMRLLHCEAGGVLWALSQARVADATGVGPALQALQVQLAANLAGEGISRETFSVPGMTPQAAASLQQGRGRGRDGRANRWVSAVFAHGLMVFQASVLVPEGVDLDELQRANFLQSLRLQT